MMKFPKSNMRILLPVLFAVLMWMAWPASGIPVLLFIAFIPLLYLEDIVLKEKLVNKKSGLFIPAYLGFFLINLFTTWWIYFASPFGMAGAVVANALLMTIVFLLFHFTRRNLGDFWGYISLVFYWTAFEYLHLDWDLSWPWLNLGNGFAAWADMVQWYEYTGTGGGTLWILIVNILFFKMIKEKSIRLKNTGIIVSVIVIPIIISYLIRFNYSEPAKPVEAVIVQPNIDPYNEKFNGLSGAEQLDKMLGIAAPLISPQTRLVVCPETALPDGIWLNQIYNDPDIRQIRKFISNYAGLRFITGFTSYQYYDDASKASATARKFRDDAGLYDAYNSGLQVSQDSLLQVHHKSKLVPGVEKMPYPVVFGYLENFAIDLGGISGSLGTSENPAVFKGDSIIAAPVICYESVYGDYVGEYVRQGANIICIITNDGWWGNTPGYRQHCQYARLRAIEHRRSIIRSANTGISCFIDQKGDISQATSWWVPAGIRGTVNLNNDLTFYSRHGDYPGITALWSGAIILMISMGKRVLRKKPVL